MNSQEEKYPNIDSEKKILLLLREINKDQLSKEKTKLFIVSQIHFSFRILPRSISFDLYLKNNNNKKKT